MDEATDDAFELWRAHEALVTCPALAGLEALHLRDDQLTSEGVSALTRSPHLTRLHTLSLTSEQVDDEAARLLATAPNLAQLRALELDAWITDAGVGHLAHSETLRLADLGLSGACAEAETWRTLGTAPITASLHSLSLGACELDAPRQRALLAGGLPERLRQLNLSSNPLGPGGVRALLDAGGWAALTALRLAYTEQTVESITTLASALTRSDLELLTVHEHTISADVMDALKAQHTVLW